MFVDQSLAIMNSHTQNKSIDPSQPSRSFSQHVDTPDKTDEQDIEAVQSTLGIAGSLRSGRNPASNAD